MPKIKVVELSACQRAALEHGHQHATSHALRQRCQMILLKSQGYSSSQVAAIVGSCEMSVHNWVHRYQEHGLEGLTTRPGRGRKAILQQEDLESVRAAVAEHRQRLSIAKVELEQSLGKSFCQETLARFVKKTVVSISECQNVPDASRCRKFTRSKSKP
jgi:transposase